MRERLAALAHEQWRGWMEYLFQKSHEDMEGQVIIPAGFSARWKRQTATHYDNLPEAEKQSDRQEADRVLELIRNHYRSMNSEELDEWIEQFNESNAPMLPMANCFRCGLPVGRSIGDGESETTVFDGDGGSPPRIFHDSCFDAFREANPCPWEAES